METQMFSIITVCYNNLDGLKKTYQSVANQTGRNYEWIIVDGGSVDGTAQFLESLRHDNTQWVSEADNGLYDAMNKGISMASGQYLIFMNSDDEFAERDTLALVHEAIELNDFPDLIYGDARERKLSGELVYKKGRSHNWAWYGMFTHHQSMFYKLSSLRQHEILYNYQRYPTAADYAFTAMMLKIPDLKVLRIKQPLCTFMRGGISAHSIPQGSLDQWLIKRDILGLPAITRYLVLNLHILSHCVKTYLPRVYEMIRFKKG